ncbi:hypothetical protein OOK13_43360 [Streptomyces sp. NBC_00378]|uniref:hypothetical protein n=1 Tax=unclassified Streptomyces TaxID=2593676 RepID=UPI0022583C25|nr:MULTISPECIES: hypothetical protein [unclassified Streptomyces]MCX5115169.1 hypothetical protein [Streptomyces sp. NBC_00378]
MTAQGEALLVCLSPGNPDFEREFLAEGLVYARLAEELTAAETRPAGPEPDHAVDRLVSPGLAVTQRATCMGSDGKSWARCFTRHGSDGFPCSIMRYFTRTWRRHPGHRSRWNETLGSPSGLSDRLQDMLRVAARGGFRNDFLAGEAQGQTSPSKGDQVT